MEIRIRLGGDGSNRRNEDAGAKDLGKASRKGDKV